MENKRVLKLILCVVFGLAAAAASLLPVAFLPALLVPVLMFVAGSILGFPGAFLSTVACFLLSMVLFGNSGVPDVVFAGVCAFGGAVVMSFSRRSYEVLVGACGVTMLGIWSNILVAAQMFGSEVIEQLFVADASVLDLMRQSYSLMGYTEREVSALIGEFSSLYGEMVPAVLLGIAMIAGLAAFLLASWLTKGSRQYAVPPFALWTMPKGSVLGALLFVVAGFLGSSQGWPGFSSVLLAAQVFVTIAYSLQGLAVVWFILGRTRLPFGARLPVAVLALMFVGTGLLFVAIIDQLLGFRKRVPPKGSGPSGPHTL
ncbi:MAG: DUF2232 domain-containing protein [Christensenellales bacterium]